MCYCDKIHVFYGMDYFFSFAMLMFRGLPTSLNILLVGNLYSSIKLPLSSIRSMLSRRQLWKAEFKG